MVISPQSVKVPDRGDIVWLSFDPQLGHEQAGRRPALVISPASYNGKVGLALLCPITSLRTNVSITPTNGTIVGSEWGIGF